MNISGPPQVSPPQKPNDPGLGLRANQRFAAEVLQVSGEQVTLSVQGVRIVARMASADQAASLVERRIAQFLVKDASGPIINLQLLKPGASIGSGLQSGTSIAPELVQRLVQNAGLALNEANINIARALLQNGLTVSAELVSELKTLLDATGAWGPLDAQNAAMLKAAGLPVTPGSLSLAEWSRTDLTETLAALKNQLQTLIGGNADPALKAMGQKAASLLDEMVLQWKSASPEMAERLKQVVSLMGSSLEHDLAEQIRAGDNGGQLQDGLMVLARLRQELVQAGGNRRMVGTIDQFLETTRWLQFTNTDPEATPSRGQWLRMDLPLQLPAQSLSTNPAQIEEARLKIAYQAEGEQSQIDPGYTRLVIQVELRPGEVLDIDLSLVGKQVGAQIKATSKELGALAEEELPSFQEGLQKLGYALKSVRCQVEQSEEPGSAGPKGSPHKKVNLEV